MIRAVIYARYSTELQNEKSIVDQINLCRKYAESCGLEVVGTYADEALSGTSIHIRPEIQKLIQHARKGAFEVVIGEDLDRISRRQADLNSIHELLEFLQIKLMTPYRGEVDALTAGISGLFSQQLIEGTKNKIRRGLSGKVRAGLSAGGRAYGYMPDPTQKGGLSVVPDEAEVVLRIFSEYADGRSPREIASGLNKSNVLPPRGARWNASAIIGWEKRKSGILRNRLYAGEYVWNKVQMVRNSETGRRVSRPNPPEKWEVAELPDLRIVPEELFRKVQGLVEPKNRGPRATGAMKRPKHLLSGLLRCCACEAGMSSKGRDKTGRVRIRCSAHAESGSCPDPRSFYLDVVEDLVLETLRNELQRPERLVQYVEAYNRARKEHAARLSQRRGGLERRINALDGELTRLVEFVAKGIGSVERIRVQMDEKENDLARLRAELRMEPAPIDDVVLHPVAVDRYRKQLSELRQERQQQLENGDRLVAQLMRELIDHVVIYPDREGPKGTRIEIRGKLRALIEEPAIVFASGGTMVAEEGLEPPNALSI